MQKCQLYVRCTLALKTVKTVLYNVLYNMYRIRVLLGSAIWYRCHTANREDRGAQIFCISATVCGGELEYAIRDMIRISEGKG